MCAIFEACNRGYILELVDILTNFSFTATQTKRDCK